MQPYGGLYRVEVDTKDLFACWGKTKYGCDFVGRRVRAEGRGYALFKSFTDKTADTFRMQGDARGTGFKLAQEYHTQCNVAHGSIMCMPGDNYQVGTCVEVAGHGNN